MYSIRCRHHNPRSPQESARSERVRSLQQGSAGARWGPEGICGDPWLSFLILVPLSEEEADLYKSKAHTGQSEEEDVFQDPVLDGVDRVVHRKTVSPEIGHQVS